METFKTKKITSTKQNIVVRLYENKPFSQKMTKTACFNNTKINIKDQIFYIKDCKLPLEAATTLSGYSYPAWVGYFVSRILNNPPSSYINEFDVSVKYGEADTADITFYGTSHSFSFYVSEHVEQTHDDDDNDDLTGDPYLDLGGKIIKRALKDIETNLDIYILNPNEKNLKALKGSVRIATTPFMDNYNLGNPIKNLVGPFLEKRTIKKGIKDCAKYNSKQIELVTQFC